MFHTPIFGPWCMPGLDVVTESERETHSEADLRPSDGQIHARSFQTTRLKCARGRDVIFQNPRTSDGMVRTEYLNMFCYLYQLLPYNFCFFFRTLIEILVRIGTNVTII